MCDHVLSFPSVKSPDTTDEDDKFGKYRWFGTKDKTRYIPFSMSLMFDQEKIFIEVQNQDFVDSEKIRLEIARFILESEKSPNQSEVIDTVKTQIGLSEKSDKGLIKTRRW